MELENNVIHVEVVNDPHSRDRVFIPLMNLTPSDANVDINFQRRQFSLCLYSPMSIN